MSGPSVDPAFGGCKLRTCTNRVNSRFFNYNCMKQVESGHDCTTSQPVMPCHRAASTRLNAHVHLQLTWSRLVAPLPHSAMLEAATHNTLRAVPWGTPQPETSHPHPLCIECIAYHVAASKGCTLLQQKPKPLCLAHITGTISNTQPDLANSHQQLSGHNHDKTRLNLKLRFSCTAQLQE